MPASNIPSGLRQELVRKSVHLSSLWIPVGYYFIDKGIMLTLLVCISLLTLSIELARHHLSPLDVIFQRIFGAVMRENETTKLKKLTGATPLLIAATLTIALFSKPIALAALFVLIISDTAAALIGKAWGNHPLRGKSFEGTAAFFVSALTIIITMGFSFPTAILASLAASITELESKHLRLDDNFTIPIITGLALLLTT